MSIVFGALRHVLWEGFSSILRYWWVLAGLAVAVGFYLHMQSIKKASYEQGYTAAKLAHTKADRDNLIKLNAIRDQLQEEYDEKLLAQARRAQQRIDDVSRERIAAVRQLDGVQKRIRAYADSAKREVTATAATGEATATDALDLLADLLARSEAHKTELAAVADEARERGLYCERLYERARGVCSRPAPQPIR